MPLDTPLPNQEALASVLRRKVMPTSLTTAELRAVSAGNREMSFYSARTLLTDLLEAYKNNVVALLDPQQITRADRVTEDNPEGNVNVGLNDAYAREGIKKVLREIGYQPNPDERGTITDLSSDSRINLVLQTNKQLAQGEGWWLQGQNAAVLDQWPAQELFRAEARDKHRDWIFRWREAGAQTGAPIGTGWTITPDGRMIALKNHDIWNWIGSSELFSDALDVVWPPFAFNSGMWVRDIDRSQTEAYGLMKRGDAAPKPVDVVTALKNFTAKISKLAEAAQ
jgi:hypothetical protein